MTAPTHAPQLWWQRHLLDLLALVGGFAVLGSASRLDRHASERGIDGLALTLGLLGIAAVLVRRWSPLVSLLVPGAAVALYLLLRYPNGPTYFLLPLGVFSYGFHGPRRLTRQLEAIVIVLVAACAYLGGGQDTIIRTTIVLSWGLAAAVLAELLRTRTDRAEERRKALLQQQKRAQAEQQLALARDLHDSVAHALTAITVQAALAERLARERPDEAIEAARAARIASRDALADLGLIVRSLREPGTAPTRPQHGVDEIDALVEQAREAGLRIDLDEVWAAPLSDEIQGAAYRVVQEGLTNAVRYAPGSVVRVVLHAESSGLRVSLTDDGPAPGSVVQPSGGGHGLLGMAERVLASGGVLRHGPRPDGGYFVEAIWETR